MTLRCSLSIISMSSSRNTTQPEAEAAARAKQVLGPVMSLKAQESVWGHNCFPGAKVLVEDHTPTL